jgi:5-methylcytosine-specific restriction enzyme subunit McrC
VTETVTIRESKAHTLGLSDEQHERLVRAGRRLASSSRWWGSDETVEVDRSLISCTPAGDGQYRIWIRDAVGAVALPDMTIIVQPKVPLDHFLFLLSASKAQPRFDFDKALANPDASLWELVANWYVDSAERLIRQGLVKDYRSTKDVLPIARGRIRSVDTSRLYYSGRIGVNCEFDEFDYDNELNRIVKAAAVSVSSSQLLDRVLRRRAARIVEELFNVGYLSPRDLGVEPDLHTSYYREPLALAKRVIAGQGVAPQAGTKTAWTFLVRTPELVEGGIRNLLADALSPQWHLARTPRGRRITGSTMTLNPDLVFEAGLLTGDVKYKLPTEWDRGDLYQAVVFATGFRARQAALIHFGIGHAREPSALPELIVGDLPLSPFVWNAGEGVSPDDAAQALIERLAAWLAAAIPEGGAVTAA